MNNPQKPLIRACKPKKGMHILDATAGWGKDAFILAASGAEVLMLERHPVMAEHLKQTLETAKQSNPDLQITLFQTDAILYLKTLPKSEYPDLIYIDPMHPKRKKSALVKKPMQILQNLIGPDEDARELIEIALKRAVKKVVVKWPQKQPPLIKPTRSLEGKTTRFDIYEIP